VTLSIQIVSVVVVPGFAATAKKSTPSGFKMRLSLKLTSSSPESKDIPPVPLLVITILPAPAVVIFISPDAVVISTSLVVVLAIVIPATVF